MACAFLSSSLAAQLFCHLEAARRTTEDFDTMVPSDASVEAISAVFQRMEGFHIINGKL